jgi:hypothetical protein
VQPKKQKRCMRGGKQERIDSDLPYWPRSLDWNVRPVSEAEQGKFHHW